MMGSKADDSIREAVRVTVELQLGVPIDNMNARLLEDLEADSFDLMNIVTILEEDHGVEITEEEAATVTTVTDLAALVERLRS
jgi:acyl carrier protein